VLYLVTGLANNTWTKDEKDEAMTLLKEKGALYLGVILLCLCDYPLFAMTGFQYFMNEYLAKRQMTIKELIYAFDLVLVSHV
jgi:hypothetical protein